MAQNLQHYGVLGMHWGQRRASGRTTSVKVGRGPIGTLKEIGGLFVDGIKDDMNQIKDVFRKAPQHAATKEIIKKADAVLNNPKATKKELEDALESIGIDAKSGKLKTTKPVYDEKGNDVSVRPVRRLFKEKGQSDKAFDAEVDAEMNPKPEKLVGKPVKTLFGTRTEPVFDASGKDISSKPFARPFKKKGQSDKDYDAEIDAENSDRPNDIAKRKVEDAKLDHQAKVQLGVALAVAGGVTLAMIAGNKALKNAATESIMKKYGPVLGKMILEGKNF